MPSLVTYLALCCCAPAMMPTHPGPIPRTFRLKYTIDPPYSQQSEASMEESVRQYLSTIPGVYPSTISITTRQVPVAIPLLPGQYKPPSKRGLLQASDQAVAAGAAQPDAAVVAPAQGKVHQQDAVLPTIPVPGRQVGAGLHVLCISVACQL